MRLHRLEIEGFGPFRARQVVDFDAFSDDGIFLIAGRTGAGKSSILDAVCFGLYGSVPRYESGEKRLRSDHCEPDDITEVVIEFSSTAGRYRVTRSPEYSRPAKRGGGMTKQAPAVALDEWTDAGWVGVAARAVDVGNELDSILQLSREQFLQVILLAQNRFARFLLADSKERQLLLRRLFGTERFSDVQSRFEDRRKTSANALGARLATVTARVEEAERLVTDTELWGEAGSDDATTTADRLDALRRALARAQYRLERRAAERDDAEKLSATADQRHNEIRELRQAQAERDRARTAMAANEAAAPMIRAAKHDLERARAAESLRGPIAALRRVRLTADEAEQAEATAREVWAATGVSIATPVTATALREWAAQRTQERGSWQRAAELESESELRADTVQAAQAAVADAQRLLAGVEEARSALPARLERLTAERDEARSQAERVEERAQRSVEAVERRDAAQRVVSLAAELDTAEHTLAEATAVHAHAQAALARLRQRRLDGFAGELVSGLIDGVACAVCGATDHPAPAVHADPVSPEDIADAEATRDTAAQQERDASDAVAHLRADHAVEVARAGGRTVEQAEAECAAAAQAHAQALAAGEQQAALDAQLRDTHARGEAIERERAQAEQSLGVAREGLAVHQQRDREAREQIEQARGSHESVAARLREVVAHIDAATALAAALTDSAQRAEALVDAAAIHDAALADSPFDDSSEAEAALLSAHEQAALEQRITAHTVQHEKERSVLLELELRALPEEPIDVTAADETATNSRAIWVAAVDEAGRANTTVDRLDGLIDSAAEEHDRCAAASAEHEALEGLAETLSGRGANTHKMALETFVLAAELEEIVDAANRRLHDMSAGRYQLQHSDARASHNKASGLGIVVFDAFTGQTRPAQSLSGGETFLSSLALALGLAEVVTARAGGIQLDTLFIDEGFGSLDADTLEVAMRTLDELRQGGRTVGVISHVEAMQEQIPAQLTVRAAADGPSLIETR